MPASARLLVWVTFAAVPAVAAVSGPCSDCHTMHYSQDGGLGSGWGAEGPYDALLRTDCLGCHTGNNCGTGTPFVFSTAAPVYADSGTEATTTTLAGGNFYWVGQGGGDAYGHNVAGVAAADGTLTTPPGFDGGRTAADGTRPGGGSWPAGQPVTCAGTYGCHGTHGTAIPTLAVRGAHHSGADGAITAPGTSAAGGYRMLVGVAGFEDADREYRPTSSAHNQYKGVDDAGGTDNSTIGSLCARCHGAYHDGPANLGPNSPWLRHPVEYDLSNTAVDSEYRDYGSGTYQPAVPLASTSVGAPVSAPTFSEDSIITCVSCHRAHGSPWYKAMRWDYAGGNGGLCATCHSTKQ